MADIYSDIPELSAEQANILRRRKIAEAIQAQASEGIPTQPQMGRYAVPTNPLLALGKIGEAYIGNKAAEDANTQQAALGQKYQGMERGAIDKFNTSYNNQTFKPDTFDSTDQPGFGNLTTVRSPEEKRQAIIEAMTSPFSKLNKVGQVRGLFDQQDQAREDAQAAKLEQIKTNAQNNLAPEIKFAQQIEALPEGAMKQEMKRQQALKGLSNSTVIMSDQGIFTKDKTGKITDTGLTRTSEKRTAANTKQKEAADTHLKSLDDMLYNLDQLIDENGKPRAGFNNAVGTWDAKIPDWARSADAMNVTTALESVRSSKTMENLANAKKGVGQSFGSMAVAEWPRFENLAENLKQGQDENNLARNLLKVRKETTAARNSLISLRDNGIPDQATPQDRRVTDKIPQISEAQKWASDPANANDPRLLAVKQKLGM